MKKLLISLKDNTLNFVLSDAICDHKESLIDSVHCNYDNLMKRARTSFRYRSKRLAYDNNDKISNYRIIIKTSKPDNIETRKYMEKYNNYKKIKKR